MNCTEVSKTSLYRKIAVFVSLLTKGLCERNLKIVALLEIRRGKINDGAVDRIEIAGVFDSPFDAVGAFFDGGFGQTDENGFRHADVGPIDFDFDQNGIDSQQRKGFQFDKHGADIVTQIPPRKQGRTEMSLVSLDK